MENAVRLFSKAVEDRYILYKRSAIDSLAGLAFSYQAMGQTDKAQATSAELLSFAQEIHDPAHISIARSSQARLSLMKGDRTSAMRQLEAVDLRFYDGTFFIWLELPRLTQCRVLIAQETPTSLQFATEKLQAYRQIGVETHNTLKLVEILSLESLAHLKRGRQDEALAALKAAVRLAAPARLIRPFVELGPEIAGILSDLNRSFVAQDFVGEILAALPMPSPDSLANAKVKLPEPLSERELEVLGLLAQRLSNKEIANQLVISPLTVKKHASNIYLKLGVKNRRQAVREALALAILIEH
jgi:LuxR family maltose regulon positive regulatory protein